MSVKNCWLLKEWWTKRNVIDDLKKSWNWFLKQEKAVKKKACEKKSGEKNRKKKKKQAEKANSP